MGTAKRVRSRPTVVCLLTKTYLDNSILRTLLLIKYL